MRKKLENCLVVSVLITIITINSTAQEITIKTDLDTHKIELGGRAKLTYIIEKGKGQFAILY